MRANARDDRFLELIDAHRGILVKVAGAYCRAPHDREDLVQEAIAQLWRSYPRFDGRVAFSTWMYRIAMNVAISFHRRESRRPAATALAGTALESIPAPDAPEADDRVNLIRDLIEKLQTLDRALMLLYLDDYSYAEIAAVLGISETNVGTKIGRLKERLRRTIDAVTT